MSHLLPMLTFLEQKILRWKPQYSFESGMKILLKNIFYWKDAPLWNKKTFIKKLKIGLNT